MEAISKDFSYNEFQSSKVALEKGIDNTIPSGSVKESIKVLTLNVLQPLRDRYGKPLIVSSGYRSAELNMAVGGATESQHVKGEAADILCNSPAELAQIAYDMKLPYDQMILYPTFVHFSHKLQDRQRGQILYNKSYIGPKVKTI